MADFEVRINLEIWFVELVVFFHTFMNVDIEFISSLARFAFTDMVVHPFSEDICFACFGYSTVARNTPQIIHNALALARDMTLDGPF